MEWYVWKSLDIHGCDVCVTSKSDLLQGKVKENLDCCSCTARSAFQDIYIICSPHLGVSFIPVSMPRMVPHVIRKFCLQIFLGLPAVASLWQESFCVLVTCSCLCWDLEEQPDLSCTIFCTHGWFYKAFLVSSSVSRNSGKVWVMSTCTIPSPFLNVLFSAICVIFKKT